MRSICNSNIVSQMVNIGRTSIILFIVIIMTAASIAVAQDKKKVGVINISGPAMTEKLTAILSEMIRDLLFEDENFDIIPRETMEDLLVSSGYEGSLICQNLECCLAIGQIIKAQFMIYGVVDKSETGYHYQLHLVDVDQMKTVRQVKDDVTGDQKELLKKIQAGTEDLIRGKCRLSIQSTPAGAEVYFGSKLVGKTPVNIKLNVLHDYSFKVTYNDDSSQNLDVHVELEQSLERHVKFGDEDMVSEPFELIIYPSLEGNDELPDGLKLKSKIYGLSHVKDAHYGDYIFLKSVYYLNKEVELLVGKKKDKIIVAPADLNFHTAPDFGTLYNLRYKQARIALQQKSYEKAHQLFEHQILSRLMFKKRYNSVAWLYYEMFTVFAGHDDDTSRRDMLQNAAKYALLSDDDTLFVLAQVELFRLLRKNGQYKQAQLVLDTVEKHNVLSEKKALRTMVQLERISLLIELGDLQQAQELLTVLKGYRSSLSANHIYVALIQFYEGRLALFHRDTLTAYNLFTTAARIFRKHLFEGYPLANLYHNLTYLSFQLGLFTKAKQYLNEYSSKIHQKAQNSLESSKNLKNLGDMAYLSGDFHQAYDRYFEAYNIRKKLCPATLMMAEIMNRCGFATLKLKNNSAASEYFRQAIKLESMLNLADINTAEGFYGLAECELEQDNASTAIEFYKKAIKTMTRLRPARLLGTPIEIVQYRDYYTQLITTLFATNQWKIAFEYTEQYIEHVFTPAIISQFYLNKKLISPQSREKYTQLISDLKAEQNLLDMTCPEKGSGTIQDYQNSLEAYLTFFDQIKHEYKQYYGLRIVENRNFETLVQSLENGTLLLTYFPCQEFSLLFSILKTTSNAYDFQAMHLALGERDLKKKIEEIFSLVTLDQTEQDSLKRWSSVTGDLYQALIGPVEKSIKKSRRIIIIPINVYYGVPFSGLCAKVDSAGRLSYLADQRTVHIIPSLRSYSLLSERAKNDAGAHTFSQAVILHDPAYTSTIKEDETFHALMLPEAARKQNVLPEKMKVSNFETAISALNVEKYSQAKVIETVVKKSYQEPTILQLSCPAFIDNCRPFGSYFHFSSPLLTTGEESDGRLYLSELMKNTHFHQGGAIFLPQLCLVRSRFFNHCSLALMSQIYLTAGINCFFYSLWPAGNESTEIILREFYAQLLLKVPRNLALQRAIQKVRKNKKFAHPRYWAGFTFLGKR
ncbi:CHAT domain-containing protein [candidate division CSSED10-310 bacterium]|uniref:CHAT domain-containing protein n=1 Tax=candidate division CSSED10-310 bacterium TaxID=2855610 RepID=A0ABV6YY30_UNCC1